VSLPPLHDGQMLRGRYQVLRRLVDGDTHQVYVVLDDDGPRPSMHLMLAGALPGLPDRRQPGAAEAGTAALVEQFQTTDLALMVVAATEPPLAALPAPRCDEDAAALLLALMICLRQLAANGASLAALTPATLIPGEEQLIHLGPVLAAPADEQPVAELARLARELLRDPPTWSVELNAFLAALKAGVFVDLEAAQTALLVLWPTGNVRGEVGLCSVAGPSRADNDDAALSLEQVWDAGHGAGAWFLRAVADGVGGHRAGAQAARLALHALASGITTHEAVAALDGAAAPWADNDAALAELAQAVATAHQTVAALATGDEAEPPGTTLVAALRVGCRLGVAHVGDSRAYLLRDGVAVALTRDHSVVQELLAAGGLDPAHAALHPQAHVLTQCLGQRAPVTPGLTLRLLRPGDRLLLCTDGVTQVLADDDLTRLLAHHDEPELAAVLAVAEAGRRGGSDDATALVEHFREG
jgi:serine/threonine protein phosphatase PrpC